jgi:hypothetical protein
VAWPARNNRPVALFDPGARPDPEREERLRASAARVEIRPGTRAAQLAVRSLACPECGVPIRLASPVGWDESLACAFCEAVAPTREFVCEQGWPQVNLVARLGS